MRWFPIVLVVMGCKKQDDAAPAPPPPAPVKAAIDAAAGSAQAAPPKMSDACFPQQGQGVLSAFVADDTTATICVDLQDPDGYDKKTTKCLALDLASGTYKTATAPAKPAEPITFKQSTKAVEACTGDKCVTLDVPKLPPSDEGAPTEYNIHASADRKKLIVVGGGSTQMGGFTIVDAASGKKQLFVKMGSESDCLEDAYFVGDTIYVLTSVCAGPGGMGHFLHADGKEFAKIDQEKINVYGAIPLQVDGDQWAFSDFGGGNFAIYDVKTGKEARMITIARPEDCDDCTLIEGPNISTSTLVKTPAGKLVTIGSAGVTVIDSKTGAVGKTARLPMCVKPK
jgi:hypothetical protein